MDNPPSQLATHDLRPVSHLHKEERAVTQELGEWLDASKIDELHLCPRRYYYRYEQHLVPKIQGESSFANPMQFGTAIHAALDCYYQGQGTDLVTCPCPEVEGCDFCKGQPIPRMAALFLLHYPFDPEIDADKPAYRQDPRTRARGIEFLAAYLDRYPRETFEVLATEIPFAIEFTTDECQTCTATKAEHKDPIERFTCDKYQPFVLFTYVGRIDLVKKEQGKISPTDHKTITQFGERFDNQWKLALAPTGYMRALAEVLGIPVTEQTINAIRITTKVDIDESFRRVDTTRTPEDFEEWEREVRQAFKHIQEYRAQNFWPKHAPYACSAYNRTCEFYPLCTAGASTKLDLIANAYEKVEWNPTDAD